MLVERFITNYVRRKNAQYMQFAPAADLSVPVPGQVPALLYIHVPFCEQLCPYCSFNRMVFQEDLARAYFAALRKEIAMYHRRGYTFEALYAGGGTPTVLMDELTATLDLARSLSPIGEISVETNPNHLTADNLRRLKEAGVNRLSVGVQSFDDGLLTATERIGRYGTGREIMKKIAATQGFFDTLNIDMIFNFPTQTREILEKDLGTLIDLGVDQITYYPLMVSSFTQRIMEKTLGRVDYDRGSSYYMKIAETLEGIYRPSTAWCFSKGPAMIDEYVVHFDEYAGLGSGSIGYLGGSVYANTFDVRDYIRMLDEGRLPLTARKDCTLKERLRYDFLMKLFGLSIDMDELGRKTGAHAARLLGPEILFFSLVGALKKQGSVYRLTRRGQYYWVLMMREFFVAVNNFRDFCRAQAGS